MEDFSTLDLPPTLRQGLDALGHAAPTPVQAASLPHVLAGRDLIAQAPTGSGKTLAFGLGLLARLDPALQRAQALVLCPTRELADQVGKELRRLAIGIPNLKLSILCGGVALRPQLASLEAHDPQVVVGTPGRIQELMRKKVLHLAGVKTLVLDEADRMLDMGFEEAIREIAGKTAGNRQTLLFSATFPDEIRAVAQTLLRAPEEVAIEGAAEQGSVDETFVECDHANKATMLATALLELAPESCVVFCNTRRDVDDVAELLAGRGFDALALHGDMEQRDRDEVLVRFANRSCNVLVASDVAARGLDVKDLALVVNYELPTDADTYVHRIGRTARAGRDGAALSLVTPREMPRALALETARGEPLRWLRLGAKARPPQPPQAAMVSLRIDAGRTDKLRPGDIVGALTGAAELHVDDVGKIDVFATRSYVAIRRKLAAQAMASLREAGIKGKRLRVVMLGSPSVTGVTSSPSRREAFAARAPRNTSAQKPAGRSAPSPASARRASAPGAALSPASSSRGLAPAPGATTRPSSNRGPAPARGPATRGTPGGKKRR